MNCSGRRRLRHCFRSASACVQAAPGMVMPGAATLRLSTSQIAPRIDFLQLAAPLLFPKLKNALAGRCKGYAQGQAQTRHPVSHNILQPGPREDRFLPQSSRPRGRAALISAEP